MPKQIVDALRAAGIEKPSVAQLAALPELIDSRTSEDKTMGEESIDAIDCHAIAHWFGENVGVFDTNILRYIERRRGDGEDGSKSKEARERRSKRDCTPRRVSVQIMRTIETVLGPYGRDITQQLIRRKREASRAFEKKRPFIVVGTPGRIAEMSRMGVLKTHGVSTLVIDEADDLLASNFRRDMARINEHCGKGVKGGRRTIICSATLRKETLDAYAYVSPDLKLILADYEMNKTKEDADAVKEENETGDDEDVVEKVRRKAQMEKQVTINAEEQQMMNRGAVALPPHLQHLFIQADRNRKVDVLRRAVHAMDVQRCLIFVNFGRRSKDVEGKLSARGMPVASLHGDLDKIQRERVLKKFKSGEVRALLVSDLAARGLDIPNCDCVINLELPTDEVHYVHRAGRTGRMGAPGVVVSICEQKENFVVDKFTQ